MQIERAVPGMNVKANWPTEAHGLVNMRTGLILYATIASNGDRLIANIQPGF
jgi:hypothetical protein